MQTWLNKTIRENRTFLFFVALMLIFRSAIADWNEVPTGSMKPTIIEGDRILVNKLAYDLRLPFTHISLWRFAHPKRGEIIVFDSEVADKRLVKRVVGMPGDTVKMMDNVLFINNAPLTYSLVNDQGPIVEMIEHLEGAEHPVRFGKHDSTLSSFISIQVPEDHYLVLGDNRDNSADSRVIGFVDRDEIVGRSSTVVISLDYNNYYFPRSDRVWEQI